MTLLATITPIYSAKVGDLQPTIVAVSSLSGVQEVEPGWLLCNNALASRTTYAALFAEIGFRYSPTPGTDPGSNQFYLPYLIEGTVPIAKGATNFTTHGARGGEINHTLTLAELGLHVHNWSAVYDDVQVIGGSLAPGPTFGITDVLVRSTSATSAAGSGGAHNNMNPYQVVEGYLIKY